MLYLLSDAKAIFIIIIISLIGFEFIYAIDPPPIEWKKTFDGIGHAEGYSVLQTKDKGYIAVGKTWSESRNSDIYLVKTDSLGNLQWEKTFGSEDEDGAYSIQLTSDGGYILSGFGGELGIPEIFVVKIDSLGNSQWQKTFVKDSIEYGFSIQQTGSG